MEEYRMIGKSDISGFIVSFTNFVRNCIRYIILSLRKYVVSSGGIFIIIAGAGVYYAGTKAAYYQSDMVCVYNHLHKKTYGEMIRKLNTLVQTGSYTNLAKTIDIPVETAKNIVSMEAQNIAGSALYEDISQGKLPFYIVVKAKTPDVYAYLQPALINYMNSTPYQLLRNKLEKQKLSEKIMYAHKSIGQIDSIISAYPTLLKENIQKLDTAANVSNMVGLMYYKDKLVNNMLTDENTMATMISVEVLHGFAPTEHPIKPNKSKTIIGFIILAMIAAGIWAVLKNLMSHDSQA